VRQQHASSDPVSPVRTAEPAIWGIIESLLGPTAHKTEDEFEIMDWLR
jgi:hypothetical protein